MLGKENKVSLCTEFVFVDTISTAVVIWMSKGRNRTHTFSNSIVELKNVCINQVLWIPYFAAVYFHKFLVLGNITRRAKGAF